MKRRALFLFVAIGSVSGDPTAWVAKSNQNAQGLIEERARFFPEAAGNGGVSGVDEEIIDLKPDSAERQIEAGRRSGKILATRLEAERDPLVRQDLEILIAAARDNVRGLELNKKILHALLESGADNLLWPARIVRRPDRGQRAQPSGMTISLSPPRPGR